MTKPESPSFDEDRVLLDSIPTLSAEERVAAVERLLRSPSQAIREAVTRVGSSALGDDELVRYIRDRDDDVLRNAALEMLKYRGRAAVELGISLLKDRDPDVVLQAVLLLDHLKDPRTLQPLRGLLEHPNANVVQATIVAIGHIGHAGAASDLIPFLKSSQWFQFAAIQALGDLRVPAGVEPLAEQLSDPMTGPLAAESLARIGGEQAYWHLADHWVQTCTDDDARLQLVAHVLEGLIHEPAQVTGFQEALAERLTTGQVPGRAAAARCLLALGEGPHDSKALEALTADPINGESLPACLAKRPDLISELLKQRGQRRSWGFFLAAEFPEEISLDDFSAALADCPDHEHLDAISKALDRMDNPNLGDVLLEFYCRIPPDSRLVLAPHMRRHRASLQKALAELEDDVTVTQSLVAATLAESPEKAASAVLKLPDDARVEVISQLGDQPDTLRQLPWEKWLNQKPEVYGPVATQMAEQAGLYDLLPKLRELLEKDPSVSLIRVVETLGDAESVPILTSLLDRNEPRLQPFLFGALGKLGGPEARAALKDATKSEDQQWRRFAFRALADCFSDEEEGVFRDGSDDDDWHIRLVSAQVLGRIGSPGDLAILARLAADPVSAVAQCARSTLDG
ncbi:MAG: HEAT repeat domain-containing protein [Myxococcota bacterium]|nr:HEAT repeat domain-containing protein [Myxococcota bacterium]